MRDLYIKVCNGAKLSNSDCTDGAVFFDRLAKMLFEAGPAFVVSAKEAARTAEVLNRYADARGLLPKRG